MNNGGMMATIDPHAEWQQMYRETWHIERDFFYDPKVHGLDLEKIEAKYKPYLDGLASREEFTYLSTEMLGEIQVGHMFVSGPEEPKDTPKPGLLGADYTVESNRYRFAKIYNGQNWTPSLTAPLTVPGINIVEGEYMLAVNGRELHATDNLHSFFDGAAGKQTVVRVGTSRTAVMGATSRWCRLTPNTACATSTGSSRTGARSINSRGVRLHTSICRIPAAPGIRTLTATFTRSSISRLWCSMSGTTRAGLSPTT